jgi:hypothetical protein
MASRSRSSRSRSPRSPCRRAVRGPRHPARRTRECPTPIPSRPRSNNSHQY